MQRGRTVSGSLYNGFYAPGSGEETFEYSNKGKLAKFYIPGCWCNGGKITFLDDAPWQNVFYYFDRRYDAR